MTGFSHIPVMKEEVLSLLQIREDGLYVDGTLGGGGHAAAIAERLTGGRLIGTDRDEDALRAAEERLAPFRDRVVLRHSTYSRIPEILQEEGGRPADGILLDLGVSSYQLDTAERGFSYMQDAPLDMRMDRSEGETAADLVNGLSREALEEILRKYGEEMQAGPIAARIVRERQLQPIRTTGELVSIIEKAIPARFRSRGGHPAKRTFQALRIAVNHELDELEQSLEPLIRSLAPEGRLVILTFHSLEDRIVKEAFRTAENPCICPPEFPVCVCGRKSLGRVLTRRPILPDEAEIRRNTRAKSAKLRGFVRMGE